jgi:SecD/SecF fusion protein
MDIRNGFARATSTIVDANITTLITAIVIYKIAPDNVKGFGVTLILGILMSMYTAIFVSRIIFDVAERLRWIKTLNMSRIIGETHVDFLAKWPVAIGGSLAVIGIGLAAAFLRGSDMLNIDFTGGSSVTLVLKDENKKPFAEVKQLIQDSELGAENLSLVEVGDSGARYTVTTINQDVEQVEQILAKTFEGQLLTYQVRVQKIEPITDQSQGALRPGMLAVPLAERSPVSLLQDEAEEAPAEDGPAAEVATAEVATAEAATEEAATEEAATEEATDSTAESVGAAASASADSVDRFAGGTLAQLSFGLSDEASAEIGGGVSYDSLDQLVRDALQASGHGDVAYRLSSPEYRAGSSRKIVDWDLRLALDQTATQEVLNALEQSINGQPIFPLANKIGGRVAGRMTTDALAAILISLLGIIAYIWFRFQRVIYGLAAVVALIHDVLVTLGAVALSAYLVNGAEPLANLLMIQKFQLSLPLVAAFLTIIGYSLNDTIVIFDRIREVKGKSPHLTAEMINNSINQTLSRTLLTSLTTLLTVLVLYLIGGDGIHDFAFALVVGVIAGTYSTIFIATPALLWMSKRSESVGKTGGAQAA